MAPFDEPVIAPAEPSAPPCPATDPGSPNEADGFDPRPRGRHAAPPPTDRSVARDREPRPELELVPDGPAARATTLTQASVAQVVGPTQLSPQPFASESLEQPTYADLPTVTTGRAIAPNLLSRVLVVGLIVAALAVAGTVALVWGDDAQRGVERRSASGGNDVLRDPTIGRRTAVTQLLVERGDAVRTKDKAGFLALIDPTADEFRAHQSELFDRLARLPFADWSYELAGEGPGLPADRALVLPAGTAIAKVRLRFQFEDSDSRVEREQYLTVVPRGGRWLLSGNDDATPAGLHTERDIWDLGPVTVIRGKSSLVLGDASKTELTRLAGEADRAVKDVSGVWKSEWSRHPVVVYPKSQEDMATLIGSDGKGLSQIAAVTTGSFESGLSRGDRVVVNSPAWRTLGTLGRRVVLAHEMTHLATRGLTVDPVPIWLSEGFADYVAYKAVKVPTSVVASDVLDDVRKSKGPRALPDDKDFDEARGDIAAAYEGAWLACRMIAERYGQPELIQLYVALADKAPPPLGGDIKATLGITEKMLVKQWLGYLASRAKA